METVRVAIMNGKVTGGICVVGAEWLKKSGLYTVSVSTRSLSSAQ